MDVFEKLDNLFAMYESFTYDYLLKLAKDEADYIYRMVRSRDGDESAKNFITSYAAILSRCNFRPNETEYGFAKSAISSLNLTADNFRLLGDKLIGDYDVKMMFREYSKETNLDLRFDHAMMIFALCLCASDGQINDSQRRFITDFVPLPGIAD